MNNENKNYGNFWQTLPETDCARERRIAAGFNVSSAFLARADKNENYR